MIGLIVGAALVFSVMVGVAIWAALRIFFFVLRFAIYAVAITVVFFARWLRPAR